MSRRDIEEVILRLAVISGFVREEDVTAAADWTEADPSLVEAYGPRIGALASAGKLNPVWVDAVFALLTRDRSPSFPLLERTLKKAEALVDSPPELESWRPSDPTQTSDGVPEESFPAAEARRRRAVVSGWERYEILRFVGEGGMGTVYQARDPVLDRVVALKFVHGDQPARIRRFLQEARAQAGINHPNVCKVYEVGEVKGLFYISMQFIEGPSLNDLPADIPLEKKILAVKDVALAVHEAHRHGLIHRDIKPSNILVEIDESGNLHPFIMDFGLARRVDDPGLSVAGAIVGTPQYMAPEQARGESHQLDRRTDVYGLGATLYELLTGLPPFRGENPMAILMAVTTEEPRPLRALNPSIPRDLETITLKCLEKEMDRRYASAKALADDLQRFLDSEPILARRSSLGYRLAKKIRKNPILSMVIALAVTSIVLLAGLLLHARIQSAEQARLAREFGGLIKEAEGILRTAYLSPQHDIRREKQMVRERFQAIKNLMNQAGFVAQGPGHSALGRLYFLLGDLSGALEELETARKMNYREPETRYYLGRVLGELYLQERRRASRIDDPQRRGQILAEARRRYRNRAMKLLTRLTGLDTVSTHYALAAVQFYGGRYSTALQQAAEALQDTPWPYDVYRLIGDIHTAMALEYRTQGNYPAALEHLRRAEHAYLQGRTIARSSPHILLALCRMYGILEEIHTFYIGKDPIQPYQAAESSCEAAAGVDPELAEPYRRLANARWMFANYLMLKNENALPYLDKASEAAQHALRIEPDDTETLIVLGDIDEIRGNVFSDRNIDPRPAFHQAAEYYERAYRQSGDPDALHSLAIVLGEVGQYALYHGYPARDTLTESAAYLEKELMYPSHQFRVRYNLGDAYTLLALDALLRGRPVEPYLKQADTHLRQALRINPDYSFVLYYLGHARLVRAWYQYLAGNDPGPPLREAKEWIDKSVARNPQFERFAETYRAEISVLEFCRSGPSSKASFQGTRGLLQRRIERDSDNVVLHLFHAELLRCRMEAEGASASPILRRALQREIAWLKGRLPGSPQVRRLERKISPA